MLAEEAEILEKQLAKFLAGTPKIADSAYVSDKATLIGSVTIGEQANIWPGAVLRADIDEIRIGAGTSIQDNACIHVAGDLPTIVGDFVTVGHCAMLHACTIGNECLIGMSATILDGAVIGDHCIIAAGAVVPPRMVVPAGSMVVGVPATIKKTLSPEAQSQIRAWADRYLIVSRAHKSRERGNDF